MYNVTICTICTILKSNLVQSLCKIVLINKKLLNELYNVSKPFVQYSNLQLYRLYRLYELVGGYNIVQVVQHLCTIL